MKLDADEKQRVFTWIDLNVPYYGTSESNYYDRKGCRRLYPENLDEVLADVAARRCNACHDKGAAEKALYADPPARGKLLPLRAPGPIGRRNGGLRQGRLFLKG